jgi:hypothetical protein
MITNITYKVFIEQIQRRLQNDFPSNEFTATDNEIALYIFQALATAITTAANQAYAVEGIYTTPEAFITTFRIPATDFTRDDDTGQYIATLPHPPLNLPLGYSVLAPTLVGKAQKSFPLIAINGYQKGYAFKMAMPEYGIYYEIEGNKMFITSEDLELKQSGLKLNVSMLSPRGKGSDDETINAPDDILTQVFDAVIARLTQRVNTPKDTINDGANKKTEAA